MSLLEWLFDSMSECVDARVRFRDDLEVRCERGCDRSASCDGWVDCISSCDEGPPTRRTSQGRPAVSWEELDWAQVDAAVLKELGVEG